MESKLKEIFTEYEPNGSTDIEKLSNLINIWRRERTLTVEEAHREEQLDTILQCISELSANSLVKVPTKDLKDISDEDAIEVAKYFITDGKFHDTYKDNNSFYVRFRHKEPSCLSSVCVEYNTFRISYLFDGGNEIKDDLSVVKTYAYLQSRGYKLPIEL